MTPIKVDVINIFKKSVMLICSGY